MNNLFSELMAEAERVNNLNVEVDKVLEERRTEQGDWRAEKSVYIGGFLAEIEKAFSKAKYPANRNVYIAKIGYWLGNEVELVYVNRLEMRFSRAGGWFFIGHDRNTGLSCLEEYHGNSMRANELFPIVIDEWNAEIEQTIMESVQKILKNWLAKRMENMTAELKKANDWRERKIGGAK